MENRSLELTWVSGPYLSQSKRLYIPKILFYNFLLLPFIGNGFVHVMRDINGTTSIYQIRGLGELIEVLVDSCEPGTRISSSPKIDHDSGSKITPRIYRISLAKSMVTTQSNAQVDWYITS